MNDTEPSSAVGEAVNLSAARVASAQEASSVEPSSSGTLRRLLKTVRAAQPVSRADLARRLGVNRSTVTDVVKPLLAAGVVRETSLPTSNAVGRPPIGLSLDAEEEILVGVNVGVRRSQVGIMRTDGRVLGGESFDTSTDPAQTLRDIRAHVERLLAGEPARTLSLVGVSVPGPTDAARRRLLYAPHLGWSDVDVAGALGFPALRGGGGEVPVVVENDATAAAMYEATRRLRDVGDGHWSDFVLVRAGTGIGVGMVRGGEVYRGAGVGGNLVGEFGHMTIAAGGRQCVCGNRGCWERYASASSAIKLYQGERAQTTGAPAPRFIEIVRRAEAGERRALTTLEQTGEYLGIGIGNVIGGLGVARVVVSGRVVHGWRFMQDALRDALGRTMVGRLADWAVVAGEPTGAGLGGALEVAIDQHLTNTMSKLTA